MKYFTLLLLALLMTACDDDRNLPQIDTFVYQVKSSIDGGIIPVQVIDYNDGSGTLTGRLIFNNTDTVFDAIIDDVDGDKHNMVLIPAPGELLQDGYTFTGTYWSDSISIIINHNLGGFDFTEVFTGTR